MMERGNTVPAEIQRGARSIKAEDFSRKDIAVKLPESSKNLRRMLEKVAPGSARIRGFADRGEMLFRILTIEQLETSVASTKDKADGAKLEQTRRELDALRMISMRETLYGGADREEYKRGLQESIGAITQYHQEQMGLWPGINNDEAVRRKAEATEYYLKDVEEINAGTNITAVKTG